MCYLCEPKLENVLKSWNSENTHGTILRDQMEQWNNWNLPTKTVGKLVARLHTVTMYSDKC